MARLDSCAIFLSLSDPKTFQISDKLTMSDAKKKFLVVITTGTNDPLPVVDFVAYNLSVQGLYPPT